MKLHYFDQSAADDADMLLGMAKHQGYVPPNCLLGGAVVMGEVNAGRDPCAGCEGPREKCGGRPKAQAERDEPDVPDEHPSGEMYAPRW